MKNLSEGSQGTLKKKRWILWKIEGTIEDLEILRESFRLRNWVHRRFSRKRLPLRMKEEPEHISEFL